MLRDFAYQPQSVNVRDVLGRFAVEVPPHIAILRFEVITPDSFMWRMLIGDNIYYLYAEDYIDSLAHVKSAFTSYLESDQWELIEVKSPVAFEDTTPVKGASFYKKPDDASELMRYAADSGHDFVFLARSHENAGDAQFSEFAPRGFGAVNE